MSEHLEVGVCCGACGGPVFFHTCPDHDWAIVSECQSCGLLLRVAPCQDCGRVHDLWKIASEIGDDA